MSLFEPFPQLQTQRLLLRPLASADAPEMFRHECDPRVTRYFGRPPVASLAAMEAKVAGIVADVAAGQVINWVLADAASGALIGSACLWHWDRSRARAELGYWLAASRWGRGLVAEALVPVLAFGFARMALACVEARVDPDNVASVRVLLRLGFTGQPDASSVPDERGVHETMYVLQRR